MATNYGEQFAQWDTSPATDAELVTPSDTEEFDTPTRGLSFISAGDIKVTLARNNPSLTGETITIPSGNLAGGIIHPIRVNKVWATGTTISGGVAWF